MRKIFLLCLVFLVKHLHATHCRSGEIQIRHLAGFTYQIELITYTNRYSTTDRPALEVAFSDGFKEIVNRKEKKEITASTFRNVYQMQRTFSALGTYKAMVTDPNRNQGIINLGGTASVDIPFYIESEIIISPYSTPSTPSLGNPPLDDACLDNIWVHNPAASPQAGYGLKYSLVPVKQGENKDAEPFAQPNGMQIDEQGTVIWDSPKFLGEYNIAIKIDMYDKQGYYSGFILRDMQINVLNCTNQKPIITPIPPVCAVVGEKVTRIVQAEHPEGQTVEVNASGELFIGFAEPFRAGFNFVQEDQNTKAKTYEFNWDVACPHVRKNPYLNYLRVSSKDAVGIQLANVSTFLATAIALAPTWKEAKLNERTINLSWNTYTCPQAKGYIIHRRVGKINQAIGACSVGVPETWGYKEVQKIPGFSASTYKDDSELIAGQKYCYRIVAYFGEDLLSHASEDICIDIPSDAPRPIKASVEETATTTGKVETAWKNPILDFTSFQAPFTYQLQDGQNLIKKKAKKSKALLFSDTKDKVDELAQAFLHENINTEVQANNYQLTLSDKSQIIGKSANFSPPFLGLTPDNQKVHIQLQGTFPWLNTQYIIRRRLPDNTWLEVATTNSLPYTEENLENKVEVCYDVETIGAYQSDALIHEEIRNKSQITCATPDNQNPPCSPVLSAGLCHAENPELAWQDSVCVDSPSVVGYKVYYAPFQGDNLTFLQEISLSRFDAENPGCYAVSAVGDNQKESALSEKKCLDYCAAYVLANIFTPNGDGENDLWQAVRKSHVERIVLQVFDRNNQPVFSTQDIHFTWDGNFKGKPLPNGVYFYELSGFYKTLDGIVERKQNGYVTILR